MDIASLREKIRSTGEQNLGSSLGSGSGGLASSQIIKQTVIPWNVLKVRHLRATLIFFLGGI
jgi:hypothetical protein